jgi:hypothetical protein
MTSASPDPHVANLPGFSNSPNGTIGPAGDLERETRLELATYSLEGCRSTN